MLNEHQLTVIFCQIDDFCKELEQYMSHKLLSAATNKRGPSCALAVSEIMALMVGFQAMRFRNFKAFYQFAQKHWIKHFPGLPSYQRMVELIKMALLPLTIFNQVYSGKKTGIYYIDSTCLPVCHLKRQRYHKTFESIAEFGRTSVGWFFGLKLHLVINDRGQLIAFKVTRGSRNDGQEAAPLLKNLEGLAFGDKGYLGKKICEELLTAGLKLITRKRKNMKQESITQYQQQLLNQRGLIETVINHLKHHYQVWHTRHRSIVNAMTHLVAALAAYVIEPLQLSAIRLLSGQRPWLA